MKGEGIFMRNAGSKDERGSVCLFPSSPHPLRTYYCQNSTRLLDTAKSVFVGPALLPAATNMRQYSVNFSSSMLKADLASFSFFFYLFKLFMGYPFKKTCKTLVLTFNRELTL